MDLALRLRRYGRLSYAEVLRFAEAAALDQSNLRLSIFPLLEEANLIEVVRHEGQPVQVEERVGVSAPLLEQCGDLWEKAHPGPVEAAAIDLADHCSYVPQLESEVGELLEAGGLPEASHNEVVAVLKAVGLLRQDTSTALGEEVFYSPYVWGTEAVEIAQFLQRLPPNERQALAQVARTAADRPGRPMETQGVEDRLMLGARKVGLIDAARVVTTGGSERAFGFPPGLDRQFSAGSTDATHERKVFVAHIMFGHLYGYPGTGRIRDPLVLVSSLINKGEVGPATAIRTDYPLLEAQGIVRVQEDSRGLAHLHLVKEDVARDGLKLLRLALDEPDVRARAQGDPLAGFWVPGASVRTPEQDRGELPELQDDAAHEVLTSTIDRLREEAGKRIRQEII